MAKYYKYRSLENLKRFLEIVMNHKLWSSTYKELNDPMEGVFQYAPAFKGSNFIRTLQNDKRHTYICSLSNTYQNGLMWSFYANEHKGCCIELEPNTSVKDWHLLSVKYVPNVAVISKDNATVENVLSKKSSQWEYEQEVRFIRTVDADDNSNRKRYLRIKISRIFLGIRMTPKDKKFLRKLINKVDSSIEVVDLQRKDIDFGYED